MAAAAPTSPLQTSLSTTSDLIITGKVQFIYLYLIAPCLASPCLAGSLQLLVGLLGFDQTSGVQQQALISLKSLAEALEASALASASAAAAERKDEAEEEEAVEGPLHPYLSTFMPTVCSLLNATAGA